ncbi:MAG TPA: CHASE2 domain-containing protein [Chryseolinea sp.]|nr:CHASE2 domain-containing protein [Chryseolinea sp.]
MRKFWIDCVLATVLVFLSIWGLFGITQLQVFNAFDPIGQALSDVELTDYVFSTLREDPDVDQNIVIVNIGNLSRRQIGEQIQIISKYGPKVIGIDGFFDCSKGLRDTINCPQLRDTFGNLMLSNAIQEAGNVVLVTKVLQADTLLPADVYDSLRRSDSLFTAPAIREGYANLDTDAAFQDDVKTCRLFNPKLDIKGKPHYAFAVELAMEYDSVQTQEFLQRNNYSEVINYKGNVYDIFGSTNYPQMFYTLDVEDIASENFVPEMIKDKIVIFGFLGEFLGDPSWDDKFYTPLNKKLAGKANPDMFGAVVHANIVSMILNKDYVAQMAEWQEVAMAIILCLLNVALFSLINTNLPLWYDGITKLLQLIQLVLYSALMVMIFAWYSFKFNVTLTLAAVALVGDVYEVYMSVFKNLYYKIKGWFTITRKDETVLTPVNPEKS